MIKKNLTKAITSDLEVILLTSISGSRLMVIMQMHKSEIIPKNCLQKILFQTHMYIRDIYNNA